jgi:hypothetical protein
MGMSGIVIMWIFIVGLIVLVRRATKNQDSVGELRLPVSSRHHDVLTP